LSTDADIVIRLASAGDIPALARVWHDGWHHGHAHLSPEVARGRPFEFFMPRIETALPDCIVATVDEAIVGFAGWEGDGIGQVFVLPAWHGRGVAPLVLAAAEQKLKEQGHTRIWLQCQIGNLRARRFYEKHNWHVAREMDVTIGTIEGRAPQRVWRMEKSI
tara:strand:- start:80368 stop:80853 length:486 start_codon:yes stop_codon:yes gene_type:complete